MSYNKKHNEANGENNKDGTDDNYSWNCGVEGPTDDPCVNKLRQKQKRNLLTTLLLSQGVPLITSGDEIGKTQEGNNNAFCQDNEISWLQWDKADKELLHFVQQLIAVKRNHPSFRRRKWFKEKEVIGTGMNDIDWFHPDAKEMQKEDWDNGFSQSLTVYLNGKSIDELGYKGEIIEDDCFMIMFNASENNLDFTVPSRNGGRPWLKIIDTNGGCVNERGCEVYNDGDKLPLEGRSMVVLRRPQNI